ncbi:MAG: IS66 family transposase [Chloroflexi bacterium]|nr:IS66 family transposase [Chloroflexota bacterium]
MRVDVVDVDLESASREELVRLVQQLLERVLFLEPRVKEVEEHNQRLRREIERLGGDADGKKKPAWAKENRPQGEKNERRKRAKGFARRLDKPTHRMEHAYAECPHCQSPLKGGREVSRRQVITLPRIRVRVTEHVVVERKCPKCGNVCAPKDEVAKLTVGQQRVGISVQSELAILREEERLPFGVIQKLLARRYRLHLSVGELVALMQGFSARGKDAYKQIEEELRASPVVHGDETGWRENGRNGYLWGFSTPEVRYFLYRKSRGGSVVQEVLGKEFGGVLVTDFYGAYNVHQGKHQRCWVHLLRDIHELKERHRSESPEDKVVQDWAAEVRKVFDRAKAYTGPDEQLPAGLQDAEREKKQQQFQEELWGLCAEHVRKGKPMSTLCERVERFLPELFMFVADPRVPADNNAAERSLRPPVVSRKISGGTRSEKGSETKGIMASLFGTWHLQGRDLQEACGEILTGRTDRFSRARPAQGPAP